jgi:4-hydroxybenzoate polyprenyltransferase
MTFSVHGSDVRRAVDNIPHDVSIPLVLDIETLFATTIHHESILFFLKRHPAWRLPYWLLRNRRTLKQAMSSAISSALSDDEAASLPINEDLVTLAAEEASRGREVVIVTSSHVPSASKLQKRFVFVSGVLVLADGGNGLDRSAKAKEIARRFPEGFIYAGNSASDLDVWTAASAAILTRRSTTLQKQVSERTELFATVPAKRLGLNSLRRGLRVHQWAKNALIFVPLILGGKVADASAWLYALGCFLAISLLASSTYVLNDLLDLADDRKHWSKRHRPLANGELPIATGVGLMAGGAVLAFSIGLAIGQTCALMLLAYLCISLLYSWRLKREPLIDVFVLAALFSLRLGLGMVVADVPFSMWLLVFSMFLFFSLSTAKRQTEIARMVEHGHRKTPGRGYYASDGPLLLALGVGAMIATVLIMVIYLVEDAFPVGYYKNPHFLWGFPVIIFLWLGRIWLLAHRGELQDDPVAFALKDRVSLIYGATMVLIFAAAVA